MRLHENRIYVIGQEVSKYLEAADVSAENISYGNITLLADALSSKHKDFISTREIFAALDSIINE